MANTLPETIGVDGMTHENTMIRTSEHQTWGCPLALALFQARRKSNGRQQKGTVSGSKRETI